MASEWKVGTLSDVAEIVMGQSPPGNNCNSNGIGVPLLNGPTEFGNHHPAPVQFTTAPKKYAQCGDILFCVRGSTTGRMNWADQTYAIGRGIAAIRHKQGRGFQPFLRAVVNFHLSTLLASATGSTFPNVSRSQLYSLRIKIPPLPEQRAIAHILGTLDDKIELNRRMNETLEAMARALFKSWFVDFDPVWENIKRKEGNARAQGRKGAEESARPDENPALPEHILALFPDSFQDSELGPIPRGWEVGKLGDIAMNLRRSISPEEVPATTPYIGLQHMPRRSIALNAWGAADEVGSGKFAFQEGEILFGKLRPYFHKVGMAPLDGVCSTDILVIAPKQKDWYSYVLEVISDTEFIRYTEAHSSGTRMPRTNWKDMSRYPLPLPPAKLVEVYQAVVSIHFRHIRMNVMESRTLAALRDTLLPKLISGELRVPDAARFLAEVGV